MVVRGKIRALVPRKLNFVPRVLRPVAQRLVAKRDSGEPCFNNRRVSEVNKFQYPRVASGDQPLAKESDGSGYETDVDFEW